MEDDGWINRSWRPAGSMDEERWPEPPKLEVGSRDGVSSESTMNGGSCNGVTRMLKRVMAPNEEEEEPTRRTRQRTRDLSISENNTTSTPEGRIVLRQHIPILPHWKHSKNKQSHLENYMGKVVGAFAIDTNSKPTIEACSDLLKGDQGQMRYRLKKQFFDNVPANQVSTISPVPSMTLVVMWSDPKHKKQEKYKDVQPTKIDLFKDCHCSSKTGFTKPIKKVIADLDAIMAASATEGGVLKTHAEIVTEVLPKTTLLRNAGLVTKGRTTRSVARVEERESELDAERQATVDLKEKMECTA
ncbi:hypothetical protein QOZ80_1BG0067760 [Eleusine coracana subsp. coracana]|nr:hypothetical protein QOZ80_1BG0067760 [Eleusine coracana subsp. coracana]